MYFVFDRVYFQFVFHLEEIHIEIIVSELILKSLCKSLLIFYDNNFLRLGYVYVIYLSIEIKLRTY